MSKFDYYENVSNEIIAGFKPGESLDAPLVSGMGSEDWKGKSLAIVERYLMGLAKKGMLKSIERPATQMAKQEPNSIFIKNPQTGIPQEYLDILKEPDLFKNITEIEFDKRIVGELPTRKVIFLCAAGGRLVENCQLASYNLLVNDESGTGKDYVTASVLSILPDYCYIHKTRISPTVFTYWHNSKYEPDWTWDAKVFYPEDVSEPVLNSDVFKVMCSHGSSATVVKDQRAIDIEIKGKPVMITTTASATPNAEQTRRFGIINLDSSQNQTRAIMKRNSEFKMRGLVPEYDMSYKEAMLYLKRVKVKIPFADRIDPCFPAKNVVMRTNYPRFLDFIAASAAFHQYQRLSDADGYILAEGNDYDIARECFLKLCSNKFMMNLTINQKKILKVFEDEPELQGHVLLLHSTKMSFISYNGLKDNLDILVSYGILQTGTEKDSLNRDREIYCLSRQYNPNEKLEIPTYQELCRKTEISAKSSTTETSETSATTKGDVSDIADVSPSKCLNQAQNPAIPEENVIDVRELIKSINGEAAFEQLLSQLPGWSEADLTLQLETLKAKGDVFEPRVGFYKVLE